MTTKEYWALVKDLVLRKNYILIGNRVFNRKGEPVIKFTLKLVKRENGSRKINS